MKITPLKLSALFLTLLSPLPLRADLGTMSEKPWLGYFVGWEGKKYDTGIGSDGEFLIITKKGRDRILHKEIKITYLVEEEVNGKWVRRTFTKDGLNSESETAVDPEEPVKLQIIVTGDTKVEFIHVMGNDLITVKANLIEKKTENKIRLGLEIDFPSSRAELEGKDERDIKKMYRSDEIEAVRKVDGEKVDAKMYESVDFTSDEFLKEGATEIEIKSDELTAGESFVAKLGNEKIGVIQLEAPEKLYTGNFKVLWYPDMDKLAEKDNYISFGLD